MKIKLCTVQKRQNLESIMNGTYKPDFMRSMGAEDEVFSRGYKYMLDKLSEKTRKKYKFGKDTCIWSWYINPYFKNHINIWSNLSDLVVITYEIDDSQVVLSDFDVWCERIEDGWGIDSIVDVDKIDRCQSVQAVSWNIPVGSILSVELFVDVIRNKRNALVVA